MVLPRVHAIAAIAFVAAILIQIFLAGAALAALGGSGNFATHIEFGYTALGIAALLLLVTVFAARRPRREVGFVVGLIALYVIQTLLPGFRTSLPFAAALHPVNAALLFAAAAWYARRAWQAAMA